MILTFWQLSTFISHLSIYQTLLSILMNNICSNKIIMHYIIITQMLSLIATQCLPFRNHPTTYTFTGFNSSILDQIAMNSNTAYSNNYGYSVWNYQISLPAQTLSFYPYKTLIGFNDFTYDTSSRYVYFGVYETSSSQTQLEL